MASAARRQIVGGGMPTIKSDHDLSAPPARPAQGSKPR